MGAIVKANASLTAGTLVVLKRNFSASDSGQMTYAVDYCCLSHFALRWMPFFKTNSPPPTSLPSNLLLLQLTKTPTLVDLQTETQHGLTYFRAVYSAGVETDVTVTESSEIRNFSYTVQYPVGYNKVTPRWDYLTKTQLQPFITFVKTGEEAVTYNYDYVSITATASSKNAKLPDNIKGAVGAKFNATGSTSPGVPTTVETTSKTKNSRGEYTYSKSSTGIIQDTGVIQSATPR